MDIKQFNFETMDCGLSLILCNPNQYFIIPQLLNKIYKNNELIVFTLNKEQYKDINKLQIYNEYKPELIPIDSRLNESTSLYKSGNLDKLELLSLVFDNRNVNEEIRNGINLNTRDKVFNQLILTGRHIKCNNIVVQYYTQKKISPVIRENIDYLFMFKTVELENYYKQYLSHHIMINYFKIIMNDLQPNECLVFDLTNRFYLTKRFDELVFKVCLSN